MKRNVLVKLSAIVLSACMVFSGCGKEAQVDNDKDNLVIDASEVKKAAEDSFLSEVFDAFEKKYEQFNDFDFENLSVDADVEVKLGDGFGAFIDSVSGEDISSVLDNIGIGSAKLDIDFDRNKDLYAFAVDALINDEHIIDANALLDFAGQYAYFALPELFTGYAGVDLSELFGSSDLISTEVYSDMFVAQNELNAVVTEALTEEELVNIITDYYNTAVAEIGDAEKSNTELAVDDISVKAESYTYTITEEKATKLAIAVLDKFVNDANLKEKFITIADAYIEYFTSVGMDVEYELGFVSAADMYDELISEAEYSLDDLKSIEEFDTENSLDLVMHYVDDEFAGLTISVDGDTISLVSARKKNDVAAELCVNIAGEETSIKLVGNDKGGVYNGILSINDSADVDFELHIEDFDLDELKKGNVDITLAVYGDCLSSVIGTDMFSDEFAIKITEKSDYVSNANYKFYIVEGKEELASMKLDFVISDDADALELPESYVDVNDEEAANGIVSEIMANGMSVIMQNLINAGISQEMLSELISMALVNG